MAVVLRVSVLDVVRRCCRIRRGIGFSMSNEIILNEDGIVFSAIVFSADESARYFRIERQCFCDPQTLKPRLEIKFSVNAEFLMDKSAQYGADKVLNVILDQLKPGLIKVLSEEQ